MRKFQKFLILLFCFLFVIYCYSDIYAQKGKTSVCFIFIGNDGNAQKGKFSLRNRHSGDVKQYQTNSEGRLCVSLPRGEMFDLAMLKKPGFFRFKVYENQTIKIYPDDKQKTQELNAPMGTLHLSVSTAEKKPAAYESVRLINKRSKAVFEGKTDKDGKLNILLPIGAKYELQYTNAPDYEEVIMPDYPGAKVDMDSEFEGSQTRKLHPSRSKCLFNMRYYNVNGEPLPYEEFIVKSMSNGTQYTAYTDTLGYAFVLVPIGDTYSVSTRYLDDFVTPTISDSAALYEMVVEVSFWSSFQMGKRKDERARELAKRDSALLSKSKPEPGMSLYLSIFDRQTSQVVTETQKRAQFLSDSLKKYPLLLQTNNHIPSAIFYRMGNRWQKKVVVTDITCSMDPYAEDILLWHKMNLVQGEKSRYLFFNDGDGKLDIDKKIGSTGGIHYVSTSSVDTLVAVMKLARKMSTACGGDGPENDLEALLEGQLYVENGYELILIADNLSDVRDIELLPRLHTPVHIILCGVKDVVNEQYLEIAYKTKGSIHLIDKDIFDLWKMTDGQTINIKGVNYQLLRGKFLKIDK
jgi:hypothetical protein